MTATTPAIYDDTRFFEQALQEYRESVGDYSTFADLHLEMQQQVLERAQQLKDCALCGNRHEAEFQDLYTNVTSK